MERRCHIILSCDNAIKYSKLFLLHIWGCYYFLLDLLFFSLFAFPRRLITIGLSRCVLLILLNPRFLLRWRLIASVNTLVITLLRGRKNRCSRVCVAFLGKTGCLLLNFTFVTLKHAFLLNKFTNQKFNISQKNLYIHPQHLFH